MLIDVAFIYLYLLYNKEKGGQSMKRLIVLAIYTLVIVGGSSLYQDSLSLSTFLYVGIVVIAIAIIGMINPSVSTMINGKGYYGRADLNYIKAQEEMNKRLEKRKTKFEDIDFVSILTYLYLLVPFFISIILFVE